MDFVRLVTTLALAVDAVLGVFALLHYLGWVTIG